MVWLELLLLQNRREVTHHLKAPPVEAHAGPSKVQHDHQVLVRNLKDKALHMLIGETLIMTAVPHHQKHFRPMLLVYRDSREAPLVPLNALQLSPMQR